MDGWIGSLTEWLVIPVGGNSQMAITSDAEVMILAWYEHLFSSCAGIFCRLKSETLHPLFPPSSFHSQHPFFPPPLHAAAPQKVMSWNLRSLDHSGTQTG